MTSLTHILASMVPLWGLLLAAGSIVAVASLTRSDYPRLILCPAAELPQFMSAIASNPNQRRKVSSHHDLHHRMVEWQQKHSTS